MFPGLRFERARDELFELTQWSLEPLGMPRMRIFEMDSVPRFHDLHMEDMPSMGCAVEPPKCSICGHRPDDATPWSCEHLPNLFGEGGLASIQAQKDLEASADADLVRHVHSAADTLKMVVEVDPPQTRQLKAKWEEPS